MVKKVLIIITSIIIILGTTIKCAKNELKQKKDTVLKVENKISIIREAHRGYSLHLPENTLPAFEEAIKIGTDRIEMDVNITADGKLIIMHDKILNRTTNGVGFVTETTYAEIQKLDAGSWKSPEFKGVKVPTLKEVFELTKGKCMLNLDLKGEKVEKPMAELVEKMGMIDQIVVTGKIPVSVNTIRKVNKRITMFYELEIEDVEKDPIGVVQKIREENLTRLFS